MKEKRNWDKDCGLKSYRNIFAFFLKSLKQGVLVPSKSELWAPFSHCTARTPVHSRQLRTPGKASGKMALLASPALTPQLFWVWFPLCSLSEQRWPHCPHTPCKDLSPRVSLAVSGFGADSLKELSPMLGNQFKTLMCSFLTTYAIASEMIWFMCSTES